MDSSDDNYTHAFIAQRQRHVEESGQRLPSTSEVAVGRRVKRVSRLSRWDLATESAVTRGVRDFFVSVEGPNGLTNVSLSSAVEQVSKDIIHVLQTSRGSYTQASFSILTFLYHNLARVDVVVGSLAPEAKADQDPLPGHAFVVADVFMVDVSKLNMSEIVFHSGVALCKHNILGTRTVVPELLTMISTLQRMSPQNIASATAITRDLIKMRKMLRAALQTSFDASNLV